MKKIEMNVAKSLEELLKEHAGQITYVNLVSQLSCGKTLKQIEPALPAKVEMLDGAGRDEVVLIPKAAFEAMVEAAASFEPLMQMGYLLSVAAVSATNRVEAVLDRLESGSSRKEILADVSTLARDMRADTDGTGCVENITMSGILLGAPTIKGGEAEITEIQKAFHESERKKRGVH
jgi:hypothetical protein